MAVNDWDLDDPDEESESVEIERLRQELAELKELYNQWHQALEWYADEHNWYCKFCWSGRPHKAHTSDVFNRANGPKRARQVLAGVKVTGYRDKGK